MKTDSTAPEVAVVIATYNRPKLLERAIRSVLVQTYRDFELLIIDDRGDPQTKPVVEALAVEDPRIRYIPNETRLGLMENKNKGVSHSSPSVRYIAILDDDDTYLPRFLERTVETLDADPELMAVTTDCELRSQDGSFIKYYPHGQKSFWYIGLGGGSVIRKDIFTKFNLWWDKDMMFEDWDFGLRVAKDHKVTGISEALRIYYRYHSKMGESMSTMYNKTTPREVLERFYNKYEDIFRSAGPEALATVHDVTGKMLVRAGHVRAGREHLLESFKLFPTAPSFIYLFLAYMAPSAFANIKLIIWKNKIMGMLGR